MGFPPMYTNLFRTVIYSEIMVLGFVSIYIDEMYATYLQLQVQNSRYGLISPRSYL